MVIAKKSSQIVLHMGVAFAVMYVMTGSVAFGGLAAIVEPICNVLLMPLHDRLWERVAQMRTPQAGSSLLSHNSVARDRHRVRTYTSPA